MLATLALTLFMAADYRAQYPLPTLTVPSGWGVNIHFNRPEPGEVERIRAAGFRWVREDLMWSEVEKRPGVYDFGNYDVLMRELRANGIRPILILDYGNDLYQQGPPKSPQARAAFARFVSAAVRHYRHQGVLWEMWNEPNLGQFWQPRPNADEYIALARQVGETIRSEAPDEWYVGPASSTFDWTFLTRCFDAGLLKLWDAVTVHPYRGSEPESVAPEWARLRSLIRAKAGRSVPMISGEWGYSEVNVGGAERQAQWVVRQYLSNLASGVPLSILYDWRDDGPSRTDPEHHFGTVYRGMEPKAAYRAISHLAHELGGYTFHMRLALPSRQDVVLAFKKGSTTKLVGYTLRPGSATVALPVGDASFEMTSPSLTKSLAKGVAKKGVTLTAEPRVFSPTSSSAALKALADWQPLPPILAVDEAPQAASEALGSVQAMDLPGETQVELRDVAEEEGRPQPGPIRLTLLGLRERRPQPRIATEDVDPRPRFLRLGLRLPDGTELAQEATLYQPQPMTLGLTAAGKGIAVMVDNPSGRAMEAMVRVANGGLVRGRKVRLEADRPVTVVQIPDVPASWLGTRLRVTLADANRPDVPMIALDGVTVRSLAAFADEAPSGLDAARYDVVPEGDEKVKAEFTAVATALDDAPMDLEQGARITYTFPVGWKYLTLKPKGAFGAPLPGKPLSLGMYVRGDASGNMLRMRFMDSTNQTFQPDAGPIDWKGWKYVVFKLDTSATGRWGGANDGIIHYPIRIETAALVDSYGGKGGSGEVTFAGLTLVSRG